MVPKEAEMLGVGVGLLAGFGVDIGRSSSLGQTSLPFNL